MNVDRTRWDEARHLAGSRRREVHKVLDQFALEAKRVGRCDRDAAEAAVKAVYAAAELPAPKFTWFDSPVDAARAVTLVAYKRKLRLLGDEFLTFARGAGSEPLVSAVREEQGRLTIGFTDHDLRIGRALQTISQNDLLELTPSARAGFRLGSGDAWELAIIAACEMLGTPPGKMYKSLLATMRECGWWWPMIGECVMAERPSALHFDGYELHRLGGPAVWWRDGLMLYFIRDRNVPHHVAHGLFTARGIDEEPNVEIRMAMIHVYGMEKYLQDSNARVVQQDAFGTLYKKEYSDQSEELCMVRVKNSTPEPDGTFKDYILCVPPYIVTAREAVAWTFGLKAEEYAPRVET